MDRRRARRPSKVLDVVGAAVAALLAFTAVPAVLVLVVGNPLSDGLGHAWHPVARDALCALVLAAWVAWVACCAQLVRTVVEHVHHGDVGPLGNASVVDRIAARIAVGVLALTGVGAPLALPSGAGATVAAPQPAGMVVTAQTLSTVPHTPPLSPDTATYAVRPGDTLWTIADVQRADGADWMALAALNLGREMGGGTRFVDPDHVRAGWSLVLPADARAPGQRRHSGRTSAPPQGQAGHLPELVALGMGSLACAGLARRARRRRQGHRFAGDLEIVRPSEGAVDAAVLLGRFEDVPALSSFEAANRLLGRLLLDRQGRRTVDPVGRAICVSPSGVTLWLAAPRTDAPDGWVPVMGGDGWHVDHSALAGQEPFSPFYPVVVPVGDDEEGSWLVPLGPGDVLPLLGESAAALRRSGRSALGAWAWSDTLMIVDDPLDPDFLSEVETDPPVARHLVFFGDPASLSPEAARRCAVVTTDAVAASDLTILVDRHGATLHPMGRVVRPHLQSAEVARHLDELLPPAGGRESEPLDTPSVPARASALPRIEGLAPGTVDVRLLTMTPRLEGLREELPPNRARRAIELVAYLALHHPDVITSDRLRTRVLGSSDADAASKTLFNTAHAARRALGADEQGELLFPAGTRNGLYQVSSQVTVDVQRAAALAAEGKTHHDADVALAYLHAALDLVEGEPLANALSGYSWWEAEGHGGRIAAVLVDAACTLATLAAEKGHFELGRWGLERARLVEPYSEALSRSAMQLAAAEGDADRLRLEWRECQRRIDTLDPGSSPSPRTESLYGELSRRVPVGVTAPVRVSPRYTPAASD